MTIYPYGLSMAAAAVIALLLGGFSFRKAGIKADALSWFAVLALPMGLLGARIAYCLATLDWVLQEGFSFFFQFTRGGYMLYGALAGGALALWLTSRITGESFARMADQLTVPVMVMILLGRLAEGLVGQGYGWCVEDWFMEDSGMSLFVIEEPTFFYHLPFAVADMYQNYNWAVFIFEALCAGVIALILWQVKVTRQGGKTVLMLLLYASTQVLCESLRQDAVLRWGFVRINQVIGAVLIAGILALCYYLARPRSGKRLALSIVEMVLCMLMVMAMEFALEKKISAIEFIPMDVCYVVMALSCLGLILAVLPLWKRAYQRAD